MADGTSNTSTADTNTESSECSVPCRAGAGGKAIAMRTISRPKIIGAISPPPYAQSSPPKPDVEGAQSPPAAHRNDSLATNRSAGPVTEDRPPTRRRGGWGRAGVFAVVACLAWLAWPTAAFAQATLTLRVADDIAGDDTINIAEKANGFPISGDTGAERGVTVEVTIGTGMLSTTSVAIPAGDWSVIVPSNAGYIMGSSVLLTVTATKTGFTSATPVSRTLTVDLTAPTVSYTAPLSLTVGDAIIAMVPTKSEDIDSYAISSDSLLRGLSLNGATGVISGMPTTGNPNTQTVEVLATDDAGNTGTAMIDFPPVAGPEPGVTVDPPAEDLPPEGLSVPEGGSVQYTLVLDTEPTHEVTIQVSLASGDDDLTAAPTTLTFTTGNWYEERTVTVSAAEDDDGEAGIATFAHNAVSADSSYNGIGTPGVKAFEADNDTIGVIISPTALSVPEGGSATYTVRLGTKPLEDVTVEATRDQRSDVDLTVSSDTDTDSVTLTFTNSNWNTEQTVTVSAAEDDADELDGVAIFSHGTASFDDDYYPLDVDSVTATEADNEKEVTVTIQTEVSTPVRSVFEVTIIFSAAVTGFERSEIAVTNGSVTDFSGSGTTYKAWITPSKNGEVIVEVAANVVENGNPAAALTIETAAAVSFAALSYTATEGGEAVTVTVQLSHGWGKELAIPIGVKRLQPESTEVDDYTVDGLEEWDAQEGTGKLTFSAGETEQTFTIAANDDEDGEDETLELGFGELPEIALAGEPGVATVTLEDKGLVELEVSFGQAAYMVKEGQTADIAVNVSPIADRRVDVPLMVAPKRGATVEDYSGVPAKVVFEAGERQRTITVEVMMDDVNDPGEGIVLSLGALAQAVSAGEPASTEVHFEQRRMAERFSQTQEAMLAVIARSTAVSAQTAIEGRFERHRQWSRLGPSVGGLSTAPPGSDNSAEALNAGESEWIGRAGTGGRGVEGPVVHSAWGAAGTSAATGSAWNAENGGTGAPGSWLRSLSLGSLGNLARFDPTHRVASPGSGMAPSGSVYRQDRLDASGAAPPAPGSGDFSGMRGQAFSLSGVSFELSSGAREAETSRVAVLWGQGDVQRFNGDLRRLGMAYRGGLEAAHIGLDLYANDQMLAGLSFMRSWGDLEYTDDGIDGVLESRMTTFHPYLYWQLNGRLSMWSIGGFGGGQVAVEEPGRAHHFNADFRMLAGGVRAVLSRQGSHEWGLRGDGFTAYLETGALEDIAQVSGEAHRSRLLLDWVHDEALSVGRSLRVQVEAGWRFDGGDAERGRGLETGIRLGYLDAHRGLDVALHGRVLLVHASDYRDWGVGVQASWDPGEKQRGFRASLTSSWGRDGGGRTTLWDNADSVMRPAGMGAMAMGSQYRMESEVAYGGVKALGLPGLLTPYSRWRWGGQGRELALGTAWSLPTGSQQALPLLLELETIRREAQTGPADLAVLARLSLPF